MNKDQPIDLNDLSEDQLRTLVETVDTRVRWEHIMLQEYDVDEVMKLITTHEIEGFEMVSSQTLTSVDEFGRKEYNWIVWMKRPYRYDLMTSGNKRIYNV